MCIGFVQRKILLILLSGVAIGLSTNPRQSFRVIKIAKREWQNINWQKGKNKISFQRSLRKLYDSKLISVKNNKDGTVKIILTEKGKEVAIKYNIKKIKPKKLGRWDSRWRIVIFDIPENRRAKRDAFRMQIKKMGFLEMQKSVWVSPVDYEKEIEYLVNNFKIKTYVNFLLVEYAKNEKDLLKHFNIKRN